MTTQTQLTPAQSGALKFAQQMYRERGAWETGMAQREASGLAAAGLVVVTQGPRHSDRRMPHQKTVVVRLTEAGVMHGR